MTKTSISRSRRGRSERGVVLAVTGIFMVVLTGMAALSVDLSYLYLANTELQIAADAASLAAMDAIRDGKSRPDARRVAVAVASQNQAAAESVELGPEDIVFGTYDFAEDRFERGGVFGNPTAVQVIARRTRNSRGGPVDTIFAGVFGQAQSDVSAAAIASAAERDLVFVQDTTFSFLEEIDQAKGAGITMVRAMAGQNLGGDRVGVISFNEASRRELGMTTVESELPSIVDAIGDIQPCTDNTLPNCQGTDIAQGFNAATAMMRAHRSFAQKAIVLVSDGMPFPSDRRQPAIDAANAADRAGISIFTVTLTQESSGCIPGTSCDDAAFNAGLVRGYGEAYHTPDADDLDDLLLRVLASMPNRLVR